MPPVAKPRVWRFTWFGLAFAVAMFAAFAGLGILWLIILNPLPLRLIALLAAALAFVTWRIARSKIVLADGYVLVRNPTNERRIPLDQVAAVTNARFHRVGSVSVKTASGDWVEAFAVHSPMRTAWFGSRGRANTVIEAIEDAALDHGAKIDPADYRSAVGATRNAADFARLRLPAVPEEPPDDPVLRAPGREPGARFPRRDRSPGYQVEEVDEVLARIEATLDGTAGPGQVITAGEVWATRFRTTRRNGYAPAPVDEAMRQYMTDLNNRAALSAEGS